MSLQTRLTALITAIGADVKAINANLASKATLFHGAISNPLVMSPESGYASIIPYYMNDIAFNNKRGGATRVYYDGVLQSIGTDVLFEPNANMINVATSGITQIVIEVDMCAGASWGAKFGYAINENWRAKNVKIEVYKDATAAWTTILDVANVDYSEKFANMIGGNGSPVTKVRYTFSNWATTAFRMAQLYVIRYNSDLGQGPFVTRGGGAIYGPIATTGTITENGNPVYSAANPPTGFLPATGKAVDSDKLDGMDSAASSAASTIAARDGSGDIHARLFRSEFDSTNATPNFVMTQIDTASNNYIRPTTLDQLKTSLGKMLDSDKLDGQDSTYFYSPDNPPPPPGDILMDSGTVGGPAPTDTVDAGAATGSQPLGLIDGGTDVMVSITMFVDGGQSPTEPYEGIIPPA